MKWNITRKRMAWVIAVLVAIIVMIATFGCTKREEAAAKRGGAIVAGLFGLPPGVGESAVASIIAIGSYLGGKKHGHRCERKRASTPPKLTT